MKRRVKIAIQRSGIPVNYQEVLVESSEDAHRIKFRGSPTILINGKDLEGLSEPQIGNLACRLYTNRLPNVKLIQELISKSKD